MNISAISELLRAISSLLWPVLGFVALFMFRSEIANAIGRMKKGKFLGQEIELSGELERLQQTAKEASEEVASLPPTVSELEADVQVPDHVDPIAGIVGEAARSPRAALILLAAELEREARRTLASIGKLPGARRMTLMQTIDELDSHFGLPQHVSSSLRLFWDTRSKIVHGGQADDGSILSAIDSGATILRTLQSLPRETNWVHRIGVAVYSDPECNHEMKVVKGVILKTESPSGARTIFRIFPTTKTHFREGKRVAWEWNFDKNWGEAWYKDSDTQEVKPAWSSSAEFIGRNLEDV